MTAHLDEKTKISLYAVVCCLPFLIGGILWLASIDAKATLASIDSIEVRKLVYEIHNDVIKIKEHLKIKDEGE